MSETMMSGVGGWEDCGVLQLARRDIFMSVSSMLVGFSCRPSKCMFENLKTNVIKTGK
jgi:hypothetical protein